MGKRGPQPTPTNILDARGSWRAKERTGEPQLEVVKPDPTDLIPLSGKAKKWWDELSSLLEPMNVVTAADRPQLTALCEFLATWETELQACKEEGMVVYSEKGSSYVNPRWNVVNACWKNAERIMSKFGMTPADRTGIRTEGEQRAEESQGSARSSAMRLISG